MLGRKKIMLNYTSTSIYLSSYHISYNIPMKTKLIASYERDMDIYAYHGQGKLVLRLRRIGKLATCRYKPKM